jgi:hypothetical protein
MRLTVFVVVFSAVAMLSSIAFGQQAAYAFPTTPTYYDAFDQPWINPLRWLADGPDCGQGMTFECVRRIQDGRLQLEVRNTGYPGADSGFQYSSNGLKFANPNSIFSFTADIQLELALVAACPTNYDDQLTEAAAKLDAAWFNTGSTQPGDDVTDDVLFIVDTNDPQHIRVLNWLTGSGLGIATPIGNYPIGMPLTVTNTWDKANHQFITVVQVKHEPGSAVKVIVPYSASDSALPVISYRQLDSMVYSQNCTSVPISAAIEVFYDNVKINNPPALK